MLLEKRAKVDVQDVNGVTPLSKAAMVRTVETVREYYWREGQEYV